MGNIYHQYWQQELMYQLVSNAPHRRRAYTGVPRSDAREAILDRMGGPAPGSHSQQSIPQKVDKECPLTDIDARHATYSALLDKLTLSPDHRENLLGRGLTDADIQRLGYKTTPVVGMGQIAKQLRSDGLWPSRSRRCSQSG